MLEIFNQLIYEYQKGMRDMVLYTCSSKFRNEIETLLKKHGLLYKIYALSDEKINVFKQMDQTTFLFLLLLYQ